MTAIHVLPNADITLLSQYNYTETAPVRELTPAEMHFFKKLEDMTEEDVRILFNGAEEIQMDKQTFYDFVLGGSRPLSYQQIQKMRIRIRKDIDFGDVITPRRFRTTALTDIYDRTKDVKLVQSAAGHTTAAMTMKHYVKGRETNKATVEAIVTAYGLQPTM